MADSFAGLIWRVDLHVADGKPKPSVGLEHESMGYIAGQRIQQYFIPGINGIQNKLPKKIKYKNSTFQKYSFNSQLSFVDWIIIVVAHGHGAKLYCCQSSLILPFDMRKRSKPVAT